MTKTLNQRERFNFKLHDLKIGNKGWNPNHDDEMKNWPDEYFHHKTFVVSQLFQDAFSTLLVEEMYKHEKWDSVQVFEYIKSKMVIGYSGFDSNSVMNRGRVNFNGVYHFPEDPPMNPITTLIVYEPIDIKIRNDDRPLRLDVLKCHIYDYDIVALQNPVTADSAVTRFD
tara:strand:- start:1503 stop:2012 length:510 start_codon:yes stop_codon:yes gene_type:complete